MDGIFSSSELESSLGESIKTIRLLKNLDRQTLCNMAGISLNALKNLETGSGATIKTLISVIKALNRQDWIMALAPQVTINPLHMVRGKPKRTRASRRTKSNNKNENN